MSAAVVSIDERRRDAAARVPPQNIQAEESLLGAMLVRNDAIGAAVEVGLKPDDFAAPAHGHVYDAITELYAKGQPADLITVAAVLQRRNAKVEDGTLVALATGTRSIANAGRYAQIVRDLSQQRRVINGGETIQALAYEPTDDIAALVDQVEQIVYDLRPKSDVPTAHPLSSVLGEWFDEMERRAENGGRIEHPTGWSDLDAHLGGLHAGRLLVAAARPGIGKTSWAGALATNVAMNGEPVLFFSIEMGRDELAGRMVASASGLIGSQISQGIIAERDWDHISRAMGTLHNLPIDIIDTTPVTLLSVRAGIRRAMAKYGRLGLVIIDYLQLMTGRRAENRQVEVAELARGLKLLSKEMTVPVVVLAQLNRSLEARADKHPILADLRESGEIENSADQVVFIYREEHYNPNTEDKGIAELVVSKNRHGPTGTVRLHADLARGRWLTMARF